MNRHIVIVNDFSEPKGGASLMAVTSAFEFARRGHRVSFLTGDAGSDPLEKAGVEVVSLGEQGLLSAGFAGSLGRGLYNRAARKMVARWVAENDHPAAVYHLHVWSQILSPSVFTALQPVKDRLVMSAHDFFTTCPNGAQFDYRKHEPCQLKPMSVACMMQSCDRRNHLHKLWRIARHAILAQTRGGFDDLPIQLLIHRGMAPYFALAGMRREDMVVLPNPVTAFTTQRVEAEKNDAALFVGRIETTKGLDFAAEACRQAGIKLIAVGDGEELASLRAAYPEHEWVGRQPHDQIGQFAARARMLLMPSTYMEPFGLTAVEGLWSGLPVLCSDNSLLADEIRQTGAGCSLDPRDIDAFATRLREWAGNDEFIREASHSAFENTGHLALSWTEWTDRLTECYDALLDGGKPAVAQLPWAATGQDPADQCEVIPLKADASHAADSGMPEFGHAAR